MYYNNKLWLSKCAEGGTRTRTGLLPHAPETCASTNSATSAGVYDIRYPL